MSKETENMIEGGNGDAATRKSGRASFDGDGRGVWEWQVATGVFTRTVTEDQLMDLARCNLELMEERPSDADRGLSLHQRISAPARTVPASWSKAAARELSVVRRLFKRR
jgi:hypothetical protein